MADRPHDDPSVSLRSARTLTSASIIKQTLLACANVNKSSVLISFLLTETSSAVTQLNFSLSDVWRYLPNPRFLPGFIYSTETRRFSAELTQRVSTFQSRLNFFRNSRWRKGRKVIETTQRRASMSSGRATPA